MKTILILIIIVLLSACSLGEKKPLGNRSDNKVGQSTLAKSSGTKNSTNFIELNEKKEGIKAAIEDVKIENNKTIIKITLSNHIYDFTQMDIKGRSSFNEVKPIDFIIKTTKMGGHHISGNMIFSGYIKGDLKIGIKDNLFFNFKIK